MHVQRPCGRKGPVGPWGQIGGVDHKVRGPGLGGTGPVGPLTANPRGPEETTRDGARSRRPLFWAPSTRTPPNHAPRRPSRKPRPFQPHTRAPG